MSRSSAPESRRAVARSAAAVCVLVGATGCGGDDGSPPAVDPEETVRPVSDVQEARLALPGGPDWMAADDRGVWVKHDSGELLLLDPETQQELGSVDVSDDLCQGIGASYGAIWTCSGSDVVKVDPGSLEVEATFPVKKQAVQGHLVGAFDRVWVLTSDGSSLVGLDPVADEVALEVALPARCTDVAAGEAGLWLPCAVDDRVLQLDPTSGEVLQDLPVDNPVGIAVDADVWVATATSTVRLDPGSGAVLAEVDVGAAPDGSVMSDDESVWVRNGEDFLFRIDRDSETRAEQFTADVTSGGDVLVVDGLIWTTAFDDAALFVIDPAR